MNGSNPAVLRSVLLFPLRSRGLARGRPLAPAANARGGAEARRP
jgi:hypothetical protein